MKAFTIVALLNCCWGISFGQVEYHVVTSGKDSNPGTIQLPLKTINAAVGKAQPGDTITVHQGVYREWVAPIQGGSSDKKRITYRAARGEKVEIKGSEVLKGWKAIGNGIWSVAISDAFFGSNNPFKEYVFGDWFFPGKLKIHTGAIYLEGKPLIEATTAESSATWCTQIKADSTVLLANFGEQNPNVAMVEVNVRPACFYPAKTGINYITVKGFHMSQAANQWSAPTAEQVGLLGTNWSKGWIIEENIISDAKCVGITLGKDRASGHNVWSANMEKDGAIHYSEMIEKVISLGWNKTNIGSHLVKNNKVFRCGQAGICGSFGAAYSTISGNEVYDIYTERSFGGAEMAGIKIHGAIDAVISDNKVHNSFIGIWLDWMAQGTRVTGNRLYGNDYVDFFPEVNHGPYLVDNNVFSSAFSLRDWSEGGAYLFNVFEGKITRAAQNRSTPWFKPNSTIWVGADTISGGDNRFIGNTFKSASGNTVRPKMHPWDVDEDLSGYGLGIYSGVSSSVMAVANNYDNGMTPFATEKKGKVDQFNTTELGATIKSKQKFTGPDGKPIVIRRKTVSP